MTEMTDGSADYTRQAPDARYHAAGIRSRITWYLQQYRYLLTEKETAYLWSAGETMRGIESRLEET